MGFIETFGGLMGFMFFSSMWGTILSLLFFFAVVLLVESEVYSVGYIAFVVYTLAVWIFTPENPFAWMWHHPVELIQAFLVYFVIGTVYSSIFKYRSFVKHVSEQLSEVKEEFIKLHNLPIGIHDAVPQEWRGKWTQAKREVNLGVVVTHDGKVRLAPQHNKARIVNWIMFWPFSALAYFIADPLHDFAVWCYDMMAEVYHKLYKRIVAKYVDISDVEA